MGPSTATTRALVPRAQLILAGPNAACPCTYSGAQGQSPCAWVKGQRRRGKRAESRWSRMDAAARKCIDSSRLAV